MELGDNTCPHLIGGVDWRDYPSVQKETGIRSIRAPYLSDAVPFNRFVMDIKGIIAIVLIVVVVTAAMMLKGYIKNYLKRRS